MKVRIALAQTNFVQDRAQNVTRCVELVKEAAEGGAQIVCLPELATSIYPAFAESADMREWAETIPGESFDRMSSAAREAAIYVIFPMYEVEGGHLFNTAVFLGPDGREVGRYRKNIIPDVRMSHMMGMEKFYFEPGNLGYPVFPTEMGVNVGITICFERHYPEGPRILALAGADIVFVPTATAAGREMWEIELRGHAIANLLWVGGVNRVGRDEDGSTAEFYGDSLVIAPSGEVVARAATDGPEVVFADVDTDLSEKLRREWGFFRDRRPEIYGGLIESSGSS